MDRKKIVTEIVLLTNRKFINSKKKEKELKLLKNYISKSDLFVKDKKKLYKKINKFINK